MKILALDQSSTYTGFVFIEDGKLVDMGCIDAPATLDLDLRIVATMHDLEKLIKKYQPEHVCVEDIYARPGRFTAFKALACVRGALIWLWWMRSLSQLVVIKCSHARAQLGIKGNGTKEEVMAAVNKKFSLKLTNEHIADAVVVGVYGYQLLNTPTEKVPSKIKNTKVSKTQRSKGGIHKARTGRLSKLSGSKTRAA